MTTKQKQKRLSTIANLKMSGKTLQEIADRYGLTKERVRQLLLSTGKTYPKQSAGIRARVTVFCLRCNKKIPNLVPNRAKNRKYCSQQCATPKIYKTRKEKMRYHQIKAKEWYQEHKNSPGMKKLISLRNKGIKGLSYRDFV